MVTLPDAPWRHRPGLRELIAVLGGGEVSRFVGGAVRDTLLGLSVNDVDIATQIEPEAVIARLRAAQIKAVPTGLAHGTVTAVLEGGPVEVTTLRRDVSSDGRHATIAFTGNWREDAARRDFTINALYADPESGEVFDHFEGLADLRAGRVRFIGAPHERIAEDHLRIMRFFRFHARFGSGAPDVAAYDACAARANDLMALSRERIADELLKLLGGTNPAPAIRLMLDRSILAPVLPELASADALAQLVDREAHYAIPGDPIRRLAALIGPDAAAATSIGARLRLSRAKQKRLVAACTPSLPMSVAALAYDRGEEGARDALLLSGDTPEPLADWTRPAFRLSGGDLIIRGLSPGPIVAATLRAIEQQWVAADFPEGAAFERIVSRALQAATAEAQTPAPPLE